MTARIVKHRDEVSLRRELCTLLDQLPWREEIGKTDDGKVVHDRCAKEPCRRTHCRDTRDHTAEFGTLLLIHLHEEFEHQPGHTIDAGIAA